MRYVKELNKTVRYQSKQEEAEQKQNDEVVSIEGAVPKNPENFKKTMEKDTVRELVQAKSEETEMLSIPLPSLVDGESDGMKFRQEVREDSSFKKLRERADRQENDYCWKDGLLKHMIDGDVGEVWEKPL